MHDYQPQQHYLLYFRTRNRHRVVFGPTSAPRWSQHNEHITSFFKPNQFRLSPTSPRYYSHNNRGLIQPKHSSKTSGGLRKPSRRTWLSLIAQNNDFVELPLSSIGWPRFIASTGAGAPWHVLAAKKLIKSKADRGTVIGKLFHGSWLNRSEPYEHELGHQHLLGEGSKGAGVRLGQLFYTKEL